MGLVKGFPVGSDGRARGTFSHNPSTLRLAMNDPNLMNIPRGGDWGKFVKECFVAPEGHIFVARDFAGIEAVLVGYFAGSQRYTRAAKLGIHAFLASAMIGEPASFEWEDSRLREYFKAIKGAHKDVYQTAKRIVHSSNYLATPNHIQQLYPESFATIKDASNLQGMYFELFPEIPRWHRDFCVRVDAARARKVVPGDRVDPWTLGVAYAQNPFGYIHRFYHILDWQKVGDPALGIPEEWVWELGDDAKRLIAFMPQSTAAAIIKQKGRTLWETYPWVGVDMRLWIHDEILFETKEDNAQMVLDTSRMVMEAPIEELPLDPSWQMGSSLVVETEAKIGRCWADMVAA